MKIDKTALGKAVGIMLLSWAALPIVYYLIVRKKKEVKEEEEEEEEDGSGNLNIDGNTGNIDIHSK